MKKFLVILVLGLMFFSPSNVKAGFIGSGELKLKPQAVNAFIEYIKMKDKPRLFLVPIDGSSAFTWGSAQKASNVWLEAIHEN